MKFRKKKGLVLGLYALLMVALLSACASGNNAGSNAGNGSGSSANTNSSDTGKQQEQVTLTVLVNNLQTNLNMIDAIVPEFEKRYEHIKIEVDTYPAGGEGDNLIKTRLATGDMADVFIYNSGSLLQALYPEHNILDLTNEPFQDRVLDAFKRSVNVNGKLYGVPFGATNVGGWLYNKKVFEQLGILVPKTWDELMANLETIKQSGTGITPVIGAYKDSWSAQMIILSDFYNVNAADPNFADDYTANKAKYATHPAALRSFQKLGDIVGYMNEDFLASTVDVGIAMLAEGRGAQFPIFTSQINTLKQNHPDKMDDIGFFPTPSDSPDVNGLTIWMPWTAYIYKNTKNVEAAKTFLDFITSQEGVNILQSATTPTGPHLIRDAELPQDVPALVKDLLPYFESEQLSPALEYLSPIKGPNLINIVVEVGAGFRSPEEAAALYDSDVEKQAQQLGLEGW